MNNKKAKQLRKDLKLIHKDKTPEELKKEYKKFKSIYKDIKQGK